MENSKDINNRLDELFAKARVSKPVMDLEEVSKLIATAPVSTGATKSSKNNSSVYLLLIGLALVVSIGGVWYFMNTDKNEQLVSDIPVTTTEVTNQNSTVNTDEASLNKVDSSILNTATSEQDNTGTANEITAGTSSVPEKNNSDLIAEKKSESAATPNSKNNEPAAHELSKNKTYIETAGEMTLNFHSDDKDVKMKVKDNTVKELALNGKTITSSDYGKYKVIIDAGLKMAADDKAKNPVTASTKSPDEQKRDNVNTLLFNAFTDQLKKDNLINEEKYSFKLTATEMLIDGKAQPDAMRKKYLDLFKTTAGKDLSGTFKFDHGMK